VRSLTLTDCLLTFRQARLVVSLTQPFSVAAANSAWWTLKGISPPEREYQNRTLHEVLRELNRFPAKVVDHLLSLLPRVGRGIPVRVAFISYALNGDKVLSYLRVLPLVNENLEMLSAMMTLSETPLPQASSASIPVDTLLTQATNAPPVADSSSTAPSGAWGTGQKILTDTDRHDIDLPSPALPFQGAPLLDPVWGGRIPLPQTYPSVGSAQPGPERI
jgi:hypothetical protein